MLALYLRLRNLLVNDEGQDLVEYALLLVLIAVVVVGAVTLLGNRVNTIMSDATNGLTP